VLLPVEADTLVVVLDVEIVEVVVGEIVEIDVEDVEELVVDFAVEGLVARYIPTPATATITTITTAINATDKPLLCIRIFATPLYYFNPAMPSGESNFNHLNNLLFRDNLCR
jgi:hypothetical protein